jgi:hypothetical protein
MTKSNKNKKRSLSHINKKTTPMAHLNQQKKGTQTLEDGVDLWALQDKIKRMPELYKKEFEKHFEILKTKLAEFKENPAKNNESLSNYMKFISHVSHLDLY